MSHLLHLGLGQAVLTCQILPADFPGHQPYCRYTTGASNGAWHGPDLETAVRLAKQSHTTRAPVTVWNVHGSKIGTYLVQLLRQLGYQATQHTVSVGTCCSTAGSLPRQGPDRPPDLGPDFPAPSTFFLPVLSCQSFNSDPTNSLNYAEYCNPTVDTLAS